MMKSGKLLVLYLLAQVAQVHASPLFEDDIVIAVELSGPLTSVIEDQEDRKEQPFILRANGIEHSIEVRMRGKSRSRVCSFPPLRLDFAVGETTHSVFENQDKLKLVTHCQRRESAQVDALQEYAAYKIFNLLSDISYRVRLLHITYTDTDGGLRETTFDRYGFVIESASELAERVGGQPANVAGVSLRSLDSQQAATVYVFQYLIGNTDWSLVVADEDDTCCHNGDLFDIGSARYYVPYDFDLSGLANTRYARPDPSLRISRVKQRLYRGYCISTDALNDALSVVKARKDDILNVVNQLTGLSQKEIDSTNRYLDKFFVRAMDAEKLVRSFERDCL